MAQVPLPIGVDVLLQGNLAFGPTGSLSVPFNSVSNAAIAGPISASKMDSSEFNVPYSQPIGTAVVAGSLLYSARNGGALRGFQAAIAGLIATGSDRTVTVDLQKSTGGGAFASMLVAPIQFTLSSTLLTVTDASLSATTYNSNDTLQIVVTVAGSAGNQAQGLAVTLSLTEAQG